MKHPQRNVILREVGSIIHQIDDPEFLEYGEHDFNYMDTLLLCSDGLSDMVASQVITKALAQKIELQQKVALLIQSANNAGGNDNITVVLAINNVKSKIANSNKKITAELPASLNNLSENNDPIQESDDIPPKTNKKRNGILVSIFVLATLIAIGIFFWMKKDQQKPLTDSKNDSSAIHANPSVKSVDTNVSKKNNDIAGPKNNVSAPVTLDSLNKFVNKTLGKIPDTLIVQKSDMEQFAFVMNKLDSGTQKTETLFLKNLKTGVVITSLIQAENVTFANGNHPITFDVKADTGNKKAIVLINSKP